MEQLKKLLKKRIEGTKRTVVFGVGSELRSDDAAGLLVALDISGRLKKSGGKRNVKVVFGSTAPENLTGEIRKFLPTHIIIVDSADIKKKAGTVALINPDEVGGISFSTHMLPIKMIVDYLLESIKCGITIIGIQPKNLEFNGCLSTEVKKSVAQVSSAVWAAIK